MAPSQPEPIALVGSGCRFPGGASSPSKLWDLVREPFDCSSEIPKDRFSWEGVYSKEPRHGTTRTKRGYFIQQDLRRWDAQFFNITPAEADAVDPQQRLLLETVYEGLETAGLRIEDLQGSSTAVFVGLMSCDYSDVVQRDVDNVPIYSGTGTARSIHSNRISYFFDWNGPSMSIDTACSSSMMAVHLGIQALRSGQSKVAVACGTSIILGPEYYIFLSNLNMVAPDGRGKMWDAKANGYARGEGVASVVMKKLSDAIADGDPIQCVIRETGVNQDGRTKGITVPSAHAQAALIRDTYGRAGLDLTTPNGRPQYFEAHGTGTPVGDPNEAQAIDAAFFPAGGNFGADEVILVGGIKTVIGHTEGTAGMAGLLKAVQALNHQKIPPNLLFDIMNPSVAPFTKHLSLATELKPWPTVPENTPLRASVNSFGFGGSNGHAILERFDPKYHQVVASPRRVLEERQEKNVTTPFLFSAQSERVLRNTLQNYIEYLDIHPETDLRDLAWSLQTRRSTFAYKAAFSAVDTDRLKAQLKEKLTSTSEKTKAQSAEAIGIRSSAKPGSSILGIFTGQGAQWACMGAELHKSSPTFRGIFAQLDHSLAQLPPNDRPSWTLAEELLKDASISRVSEAAVSQPLCTAVQVALVDMLQSARVKLGAVVGHSSGEIAAAYAAGFLTSDDAIRIAYYRGFYANLAAGPSGEKGAMLAVGASVDECLKLCDEPEFEGRVKIAAINSASSITLSGDAEAIANLEILFQEDKKFARVLKVEVAYHSHHMQPCAGPYLQALAACGIQVRTPGAEAPTWYSSVQSGRLMMATEELSGEYWKMNMTQTVQFSAAVEGALEDNDNQFSLAVEVGPHPALKSPATNNIQDILGSEIPYTGVLDRKDNDVKAFSGALGYIWISLGASAVSFETFDKQFFPTATEPKFVENLPLYPWDRERSYWSESRLAKSFRSRDTPPHALIGTPYGDKVDNEFKWRNFLIPKEMPWVYGHRIQGEPVMPGAGYLAMAWEAAIALVDGQSVRLIEVEDFRIKQGLNFRDESSGIETIITLSKVTRKANESLSADWSIHSCLHKDTTNLSLVADGKINLILGESSDQILPRVNPAFPDMVDVNVDDFYSALSELGYGYTGQFKAVTNLERKMNHSAGTMTLPTSKIMTNLVMVDISFQSLFAAFGFPGDGGLWSMHVPTYLKTLRINPILRELPEDDEVELDFEAEFAESKEGPLGNVTVYTPDGRNGLLTIEGLASVPFAKATAANDRNLFQKTVWDVNSPEGELICADIQEDQEQIDIGLLCERVAYFYLKNLTRVMTDAEESKTEHQELMKFATFMTRDLAAGTSSFGKTEWANDTETQILALVERYPEQIDLKMMRALGQAYPSIVRGEVTTLEVLLEDDMLNQFYAKGLGFQEANIWTARVIKQISHSFPHMRMMEIGAGTGGATMEILQCLKADFASYTYTDVSAAFFEQAKIKFDEFSSRMTFKAFDVEKDAAVQGFGDERFDLIVASNVFHVTKNLNEVMANVRKLLKPGGYLVMLEIADNSVYRLTFDFGGLPQWWIRPTGGRNWGPTLSAVQWNRLLLESDFSGVDTIVTHKKAIVNPFSVIVSQAMDDRVAFLRQPQEFEGFDESLGELVIIGGTGLDSSRLIHAITKRLSVRFGTITTYEDLYAIANGPEISVPSTILSLTELDEPIFKFMTGKKLQIMQRLFKDEQNILWVTRGCRRDEPYANMTVGFSRSLSCELQEMRLQLLDFEDKPEPTVICEKILQLCMTGVWAKENRLDDILWINEPEIVVHDGKQLVPRVQMAENHNARYNSSKRELTEHLDLGESQIVLAYKSDSILAVRNPDTIGGTSRSRLNPTLVEVTYSLLHAINLPDSGPMYLGIGRIDGLDDLYCFLSHSNSSSLKTSEDQLVRLPGVTPGSERQTLLYVAADMIAENLLTGSNIRRDILVGGAKDILFDAIRRRAAKSGQAAYRLTEESYAEKDASSIFIHPFETTQSIKKKLPKTITAYLDFSSMDDAVAKSVRIALPSSCKLIQRSALFYDNLYDNPESISIPDNILQTLKLSCSEALVQTDHHSHPLEVVTLPLQDVRAGLDEDVMTLVDWRRDRSVLVNIQPVDRNLKFTADKTYWLIGLTGDLGITLCNWFLRHGAASIVISSRKPSVSKDWIRECEEKGAKISLRALDVTDKKSLAETYEEIRRYLPPIGGVVNAAMVLDDVMFDNMQIDNLLPVLKPKVDGSRNLDELFSDVDLDFFVLFSSLGFIIGNNGQSAYAAANGYLEALTRQRRSRGLSASAMHIGAIVGAGYITRAGQLTTTDIKVSGAIPLSVSDLHQLFAEAVLASPADSGLDPLLVAGLRTIDPQVDDLAIWRHNPKFSHLWVVDVQAGTEQGGTVASSSVRAQLLESTTRDRVLCHIQDGFVARLVALLQLLPEDMDVATPLTEMGVDSLVAVSARAWFTKELGVDIPVLKILGGTSVIDLVQDAFDKIPAEMIPNVSSDTGSAKAQPVQAGTPMPVERETNIPEAIAPTGTPPSEASDSHEASEDSVQLDTPPTEPSGSASDTTESERVIIRKTRASYTQSRFWYLKHSLEDTTALNITFSYHLEGKFSIQQLARAIRKIGEAHEGLRTCFFDEGGVPMQGILATSPLYAEVKKIQHESEAQDEYQKLDRHVYDLESGKTMRIIILELSPTSAWLITGYHHIAMDGAGFSSILSEMWSVSKPGGLIPPAMQYADYTDKEYDDVESGIMAKDVTFWENMFSTTPSILPLLPFAKVQSRRPITKFGFSSASARISPVLNARIKRRCKNFQSTAFHFYLTIFNTLLFRFTGIDEICVGIADSNRGDEERQRIMGCLVNIFPLRFKNEQSKTFNEAIKQTRKTALAALARSKVPFNVILDAAQAERSSTHAPLFQTFVDYRPGIQEHLQVGDVDAKRVEWSYGKNAYDINLEIMENVRGDAFITINAQDYLYSETHVKMLLDIYMRLVESFSKNPALRLEEPPLFDSGEISKVLTLGTGPTLSLHWPSTIYKRVETIAEQSPNQLALKDGDGIALTYSQMMHEVHRISSALRDSGVRPGDRVAVLQQPTCASIYSLLAIMRVGAAYVPLDLRNPVSRLQAIVDDCTPSALLVHKATAGFSALTSIPKTINVSSLGEISSSVQGHDESTENGPAVILFTSGSTGTPKGVILSHYSICNIIEVITKQYNLGAQVVLQSSSLTFDLSLNQIFVALANGGTLYVVPQAKRGDAVAISKTIVEERISYTLATPSEYASWLRFGAEDLRTAVDWAWAFSCGEELKARVKEEFRQLRKDGLRLINTYGPAESTIQSHASEIDISDFSTVIPAGRSLPNYSVYILDQNEEPLPVGMAGEIYIAGAGVSMGYLNLPELTNERFLSNPFAPPDWKENGWTRMYRTGDRGYLSLDGNLIFQGRMDGDTQIKLRGIRIELGEIETTLLKAARTNLDEVIVSLRGEDEGSQFLVAHAVFARDSKVAQRDGFLRQILAEAPLPPYMRPAMMIALERMPLTSHHKTDRKAVKNLPLPMDLADRSDERALTTVEGELVRLWYEVLPGEISSSTSVRPNTSFFDVGGSSLSLIPLRARINDTFGVLFSIVDFVDSHTLVKMAGKIQEASMASTVDWDKETAIDDITIPDFRSDSSGHRQGKGLRVLYTGATGHSARSILKKLVEDDRIEAVYCVGVRERAGISTPRKTSIDSEKIVIFRGDICQERLALSEEDYGFLSTHTDAILHCAANRSFWDNYQAIRQANMVATKVLIGMAIPRKIPFHFMSSSAVQMFGYPDLDHPPQSSALAAPPSDGSEGYLASKWAVEKVLEKVADRHGLPVFFHRPAPVRPDPTVTQDELFAEFMRINHVLRLRVAEDSISGHIDLLKLDDLGAALDAAIVESTVHGEDKPLVRYIHHMSDARIEMSSWKKYSNEYADQDEDHKLYQTEGAIEWITKAKMVGFPYMLAAQNFNVAGSSSSVPIVQRR